MTKRVADVCQQINHAHGRPRRFQSACRAFRRSLRLTTRHDLKFGSLLWYYLRDRGIHIWEGRPCYFTIAHTDEDLERFIEAFKESVAEMQRDGFLPQADPSLLLRPIPQAGPLTHFHWLRANAKCGSGAQMSPEASGPHHACNAFVLEGELNLDASTCQAFTTGCRAA